MRPTWPPTPTSATTPTTAATTQSRRSPRRASRRARRSTARPRSPRRELTLAEPTLERATLCRAPKIDVAADGDGAGLTLEACDRDAARARHATRDTTVRALMRACPRSHASPPRLSLPRREAARGAGIRCRVAVFGTHGTLAFKACSGRARRRRWRRAGCSAGRVLTHASRALPRSTSTGFWRPRCTRSRCSLCTAASAGECTMSASLDDDDDEDARSLLLVSCTGDLAVISRPAASWVRVNIVCIKTIASCASAMTALLWTPG